MLKEEFGSISVTDWIKGLKGRSDTVVVIPNLAVS
jgi:hypothetical protein